MTEKVTLYERAKAYKEGLAGIALVIAALGGVASTVISSKPQRAELPKEQIEKIDEAFYRSSEALTIAKKNDLRLDERGKDYIPCSVRQFDQLFNELNIKPVCPLTQPN